MTQKDVLVYAFLHVSEHLETLESTCEYYSEYGVDNKWFRQAKVNYDKCLEERDLLKRLIAGEVSFSSLSDSFL